MRKICRHFCRKKDEVRNALLHVFRPFVSPYGSGCGSELFQLIKKRRQHIVDDRTYDSPVGIIVMMHQPVP